MTGWVLLVAGPAAAQTPAQVAKLVALDGGPGVGFGAALGIDGDTAAIDAFSIGGSAGAVYVFERNVGGTDAWGFSKKLLPPDVLPGHYFGYRTKVDGDTIVAGATHRTASGAAYVFDRDAGGSGAWGQVGFLTPSDGAGNGTFGTGIDIDADTVVIGANHAFGQAGAAWVFERNRGGVNAWGETAKLQAQDAAGGDNFGQNVTIDGDTIVVCSIFDDVNGPASGSVYVYERNAGGPDNWGQVKKLVAPDGTAGDHFGIDADIDGDTIAVGADFQDGAASDAGAIYMFDRNVGGLGNWGFVRKVTAADASAGDHLGLHVALSGDRLVSGAYLDDDSGADSGSGYLFERNAGGQDTWGEVAKLLGSDTVAGDRLGIAVGIASRLVLLSSTNQGSGDGAAYLFSFANPPIALCRDVAKSADPTCLSPVSPEEVDNGSYDPDGGLLSLELAPSGPFPLGTTPVSLTATSAGGEAPCGADVTVLDATAPTASAFGSPNELWPPNHKMVVVSISSTGSDNCTAVPVCSLQGVTSNEPVNGTGDGDTAPDWEIVGSNTVRLRAERSGNGNGRVYSVIVACTDDAGNQTEVVTNVTVPKHR